jgi:indole-3-glycerol phosphate synthase
MILEQIVTNSRLELESRKSSLPIEQIRRIAEQRSVPLDLASVLRGKRIQLIAEVKKASPSRGVIRHNFNPVDIAKTYSANGAAAISVLTEVKFFQGSLDYLSDIDRALGHPRPPLIRKDFIFDPYQVYESLAFGADALLLIAAILDPDKLQSLLDLSHHLHLSCLVEVHNEQEVEMALRSGAHIIGINNRDLSTFNVDMATTERLRRLIPQDRIVVSESGIKTRKDMNILKSWGVDAVLVGETLVAAQDIASQMHELL